MTEESSPSTRTLPRSRGAVSGIVLVLLGAWGALAPFIGPSFNFAYTPDVSWHWTAARGWFEVLPGAAAFVGGLILLFARSRVLTLLGAWLAILAGAWFIVGLPLQTELTLGSLGVPIGTSSGQRVGETLGLFIGLGALILFFGALAFGRLSVVTARDLRHAERREADRAEADEFADREASDRQGWPAGRTDRREDDPNTGQPVGNDPYDQQAGRGTTATPQSGYEQSESGYEGQRGYAGRRDDEEGQGYGGSSAYQPESGYQSPGYGRHDAGPHEAGGTTEQTQAMPVSPPPSGRQPTSDPAPRQSR